MVPASNSLPREAGSANLAIPMSDHLTAFPEYTSRTEALRDMLRGTIVRLCFHNGVSSRHMHLDHENYLDGSAVTGKTDAAKRISHARQTNPSAGAEL